MYEFCYAALPWIAIAVTLAVFAAYSAGKFPARPAKACMGFFGGIFLASVMGINLIYGMQFGLIAGLLLSGKVTEAKLSDEEQ